MSGGFGVDRLYLQCPLTTQLRMFARIYNSEDKGHSRLKAHPYDVENASKLHVEWCRNLAVRMDVRTTHQSGPQMRAVVHELRRTLAPTQVVEIANQLPALQRGIFLQDWHLDEGPVDLSDADTFRDRVYERVKAHHFRVPTLVEDVFWLWNEKLEPKKATNIAAMLPAPLASLWPNHVHRNS